MPSRPVCRTLVLIGTLLAVVGPGVAGEPGERIPRDVIGRATPALDEARIAMESRDGAAVRAAVTKVITALGPWAGRPETATRYYPPIVTTPVDTEALRREWLDEVDRRRRGLPWVKNPNGDPRIMAAGLREAAGPLDGLARTAMLFADQRERLIADVRAGADWLIERQHRSGVFPLPVGPGLNPREKVGFIVAKVLAENPAIAVDGWIADDGADGGLQFDNGLCGSALVSAWELTKEDRYLAAARRAGDWALTRPLVGNWNYNAFSVGLLARLSIATGDERYLRAALEKAEVGVLPGQMPGGRWFDPHNACIVYHDILLRELFHLLRALPPDHEARPALVDALTRGLDQAANETLEHGFTGTMTGNFARGLQWIGEHRPWREALNVNLNAAGTGGAPTLGLALLSVLEGDAPAP